MNTHVSLPMDDRTACRSVVMLVYPGVMAVDVYGPLEAFAMANTSAGRSLYRMAIVSLDGRPVPSSLGVPVMPSLAGRDLREPIDTLLVAGGRGQAEARHDEALLAWLRTASGEARRTGSICTGSFLLAAAGLLDGRRASTHWAKANELGRSYPQVKVDADPIFVRDGNIYTSAGATAGIDLALGLIEEDHGRTLALKVARGLVLYLKRQGGQSQFSSRLQAQLAESPSVRLAQEWALENIAAELDVGSLAERARMSERTFRRTFVEQTGETPRDFVERIRLEAARDLLEDEQPAVQVVATRCGFATVDNLRRAFVRRLGITPQQYRERFASALAD